ncbi:hypothetical protein KEM56_000384 [Ascosphaera pollenicola]|nr:hypothetical protein KEM56_000384 [Ascosphaera pollenicola]
MKPINLHQVQSALTSPNRASALRTAYRHLYREGLKCIRYSTPARYMLRDTMRKSFRKGSAEEFDPGRVLNTLKFLGRAGEYLGTEHHIVKNMLHVRYWQQPLPKAEAHKLGGYNEKGSLRAVREDHTPIERVASSVSKVIE